MRITGENQDVVRWPGMIGWGGNPDPNGTPIVPWADTPGWVGGGTAYFGSAHPNGFFMAFCDGSVHMIHWHNLDPYVWMWMGNRNDRHVISAQNAAKVSVWCVSTFDDLKETAVRTARVLPFACVVALVGLFSMSAAEETRDVAGASPEAIAKWRQLKFGLFLHWGPVTFKGTEISRLARRTKSPSRNTTTSTSSSTRRSSTPTHGSRSPKTRA